MTGTAWRFFRPTSSPSSPPDSSARAFAGVRRAARRPGRAAAVLLGLPLLLGLGAGAQAQTASLVLNPTEIQAASLDGATITLIPKNSTFLGGGGGGIGSVVPFVNFHPDEHTNNHLHDPAGEIRLSATGLAKITLSGAPAGLTIASGRLLAREQPHSHGGGTGGHRSARITLAYSGPAITVDDPVTVTVRGGGQSGLLRWGKEDDSNFPPNLSADFTIRAGGVAVSRESLSVPRNQSATYTVALKSAPSGNVVISATSGTASTATVSPSARTFTSSNWSTPQTFTVTGQGAGTTEVGHAVQSSADTAAYPTSLTIPPVAVTVTSAPTATLVPNGGTTLPEGAGVTFNTVLSRALAADETVTLPLAVGGTAGRSDYRLVCIATPLAGAATCNNIGGANPSITFHGEHMTSHRLSGPLRLEAVEDNAAEPNETVTLSLGGGARRTLTLRDAPESVTLSFILGNFSANEEVESVIQPVLRVDAAPGRDIEVPLVFTDITATEGEDYTAVATVPFEADGNTRHSFDISLLDDSACEGPETFRMAIDASRLPAGVRAGARRSAVVTIRDADTCTIGFAAASYGVTEGGDVSVTLNIDPPRDTATEVGIAYRDADDDAHCYSLRRQGLYHCGKAYSRNPAYDGVSKVAFGKDYEASPERVTIPANAASHTFTVRTVDEPPAVAGSRPLRNLVVESDETFGIVIDPLPDWHVAGANPTATVTIRDNDGGSDTTAPRVASVVRHSPSVSPTAADSLTWRVTFDEAVRNVDAGDFSISGTTATLAVAAVGADTYDVTASGGDLAGLDGTVTLGFASGQDIGDTGGNALADTTPTGTDDSSFVVNNTSPPPPLPAVTVTAGTSPVTEGTNADFTVSRTGSTTSALTVLLEVSENTAGGRDFVAQGNEGDKSVTIPAGSATATYNVPTVGDGTDEPDGTVTLSLRGSGDYTQGSPSSASVTVNDDDTVPVAQFVSAASSAGEAAGTRNVAVDLNPAPPSAITLSYTVGGNATAGSGNDFTIASSGSVAVVANQSSVSIPVAIIDDNAQESAETVVLTLTGGGADYTVGSPAAHTLTINDNDGTTPPPTTPAASFASASAGIGEASGTHNVAVNLSPAPPSAITLSYTVGGNATAGTDYTALSGSVAVLANRSSVNIPVAITDDSAQESAETVVLTLTGGSGYTVGSPGTHTLTIADNDGGTPPPPPPPSDPTVRLSVSPNPVTEGQPATVTAALSRSLSSPVTIPLTLTRGTAEAGDFGSLASITVAAGQVSGTGTIATVRDGDTEDESFTVALGSLPSGVRAGSPSSVPVTIRDLDKPRTVSVSDASAAEGEAVVFTVRVSPPHPQAISLTWALTHGETDAADLAAGSASGAVTVAADRGSATFSVATVEDRIDEGAGETFEVTLSGSLPANTSFSDDRATGTVRDDDTAGLRLSASSLRIAEEGGAADYTVRLGSEPTADVTVTVESADEDAVAVSPGSLIFTPGDWDTPQTVTVTAGAERGGAAVTHRVSSPDSKYSALRPASLSVRLGQDLVSAAAAWLARFARSHVGQVLDGIAERLRAAPGAHVQLAGQPVEPGGAKTASLAAEGPGRAGQVAEARAVAVREALAGSSFALTGDERSDGAVWSVWGRGALARFDGREGTLALDGDLTTATLGVDRRQGLLLTGLALTHSMGEGDYRGEGPGKAEADLTTVTPWASLRLSERLTAWGALGYGQGELKLTPEGDGTATADTELLMAAAGARGALREAPVSGGYGLAVVSDALWLEARSDRAGADLAATSSDVSRLRLGVEGVWHRETGNAGRLGARLDLALRHDGGDAEAGFGAEVGAGVSWADPARGLQLGVEGRGLAAHDASGFHDRSATASLAFDPDPATLRGPSLGLRQDWGGPSADDRLLAAETPVESAGGARARRLSAEAGWGFPALGGRFTGSPHIGFGLATGARDYTLGWRLAPAANANAPDLSFGVKATRRENDTAAPEHMVGVEAALRW